MSKATRSREEVIAVYVAKGPGKVIAMDYDMPPNLVSYIKHGKRYGRITREWQVAQAFNATLVSTAFGAIQ